MLIESVLLGVAALAGPAVAEPGLGVVPEPAGPRAVTAGRDVPWEIDPPYPRVAGLGLIRSDPQLETEAFVRQCDATARAILRYCAYDDPALPAVYVTQGGGPNGDGSEGSPLVIPADPVAGGAVLRALIDAVQVSFPSGSVIWLDGGLEVRLGDYDVITLETAHTHLRAWDRLGLGGRPTIHKWDDFNPVWTPAVEPLTGRRYYTAPWPGEPEARLAVGVPVDDPDAPRYKEEAFLDCGSAAKFDHVVFRNSTNAFVIEGGVVRVYLKNGRDPNAVPMQMCDAPVNIIAVRADGVVIEGLHLNGGDQANESYVVKCTTGDSAWAVRGCFMADAFKHVVGTVGSGTDGSVCLSEHNVLAGGRADTTGYSHEVNFADYGDCDYLSLHNTFISGAHGPGVTRAQLLFSHSAKALGSAPMGSVILADFTVRTVGFTGVSRYGAVASLGRDQVYAQVVGDVEMDISGWGTLRADGGTTSPGVFDAAYGTPAIPLSSLDMPMAGVRSSVVYRTYADVNKGAMSWLSASGGSVHGCDVSVAFPFPSADPPGDDRARVYRVGAGVDVRFYGCDFFAYYAGGDEFFTYFWDTTGGGAQIKFFGCTWAFQGDTGRMSRGM